MDVLTIAGIALIAASIFVYLKATTHIVFPVILLVGGIFLAGADSVKTNIFGVGDIEFHKRVAEATDANSAVSDKQNAILADLTKQNSALRSDLAALQTAVNTRFEALNAGPVATVPKSDPADAVNLQNNLRVLAQAQKTASQANLRLREVSEFRR